MNDEVIPFEYNGTECRLFRGAGTKNWLLLELHNGVWKLTLNLPAELDQDEALKQVKTRLEEQ